MDFRPSCFNVAFHLVECGVFLSSNSPLKLTLPSLGKNSFYNRNSFLSFETNFSVVSTTDQVRSLYERFVLKRDLVPSVFK